MRIAYTTVFNATDIHNWSGTPYYMSRALTESGLAVDYIGDLKRNLPPFFKTRQFFKKLLTGHRVSPRYNIHAAKNYSLQVAKAIQDKHIAAVISPLVNPIAYLDCKQPIVLWTDALYAALLGFYSPFSSHSRMTVNQGNTVTAACIKRASLLLFSSEWAANSALEIYGAAREKVHVIPFGANIDHPPTWDEVKSQVLKRAIRPIKLLFLAKSWQRKRGDLVIEVAKALHAAGEPVELSIVGYTEKELPPLPPFIKALGFISKHTPEGQQKLRQMLSETHFLLVPSRAEAYGIVFCEANAFGVPCLTTYVGGIGTIVKDHINGMTFSLAATAEEYKDYILSVMQDRKRYEELALASYHEYSARLNWQHAGKLAKQLIANVV